MACGKPVDGAAGEGSKAAIRCRGVDYAGRPNGDAETGIALKPPALSV